ncbi:hypothetical protein JOQ06_018708 [Pogonophryne albipinna]|uniref:HAT C-terminal dimerisation domain-containing protein n=1 Tax=Pogonophryne albipinna TaxID=1090488 RepID=A0AAD6ARI1_9TELE|nr:hypothetical protein JOQ06_018708 [Pogonophryne albipinna]
MKSHIDSAKEQSSQKLHSQLKVVFHMTKNDIPGNQFRGMTDLLRAVGAPDFGTDDGIHKHSESLCDMERALEGVIMRQLDEKLKASEFIGIIIDETVSITVENKLIVYAKIENKGKIDNFFLGNYNLHSRTAQCIYEKVVEVLRGRGIELSKIMGLGLDGASVMTGKRAGVGALLKRVNPFLIQVHCVTHRAALAAVDAANAVSQEDANLGSIRPIVHASIAGLTQLKDELGPEEVEFQNDLQDGKYGNVEVTHLNERSIQAHTNVRSKYIQHLINALQDRFPDDTLDLISSLDILLNPSRYPHAQSAFQEYARDATEMVIAHFGHEVTESAAAPLIDVKRARRDAVAVMTALHGYGGLTFATACKVLICEFSELYPDWAALAKIACVLPVSSVPAERGFSLLNRVKTSLRSRLEEERVMRLMRIASCKDTLDTFHFSSAAEDFAAMKARRK